MIEMGERRTRSRKVGRCTFLVFDRRVMILEDEGRLGEIWMTRMSVFIRRV
jgi:hypothetical protein